MLYQDAKSVRAQCQISFVTQIPVVSGFQVNNVYSLNFIKMHLKCHMLKSSVAIYLLTLLTNVIVDANHVDQD